ncbi:BON domain-containing protein [Allosphingosinicella humi]
MQKSDSQLQRDVLDELKWDPRVNHAQIGVTAKDGVVTLNGFVPTYAEKSAAEKAACRVMGVNALAEEIEVRFASDPKTSDAEIAQRILDIFAWDVTIPDQKLSVKVEHGWVTLTGSVDWHFQREAARKAAGKIGGVKGISNLVEVKPRPSPEEVRERILAAFKRSSEVDASSINVAIEGNTVRLGGKVRAWNERQVAERAAWSAPGVTNVVDNIILA